MKLNIFVENNMDSYFLILNFEAIPKLPTFNVH